MRRRWFRTTLKWSATAAIWSFLAAGGIAGWFALDLPDVDSALAAKRQPTITMLAADGTTFATFGALHGPAVPLVELPPFLPQAVLAIEDRRFYNHFGLDIIGLARAMMANVWAGRVVQGGSTITQQVAKNLFLTPQRTFKRKVQEALLALWLEHRFSKDQILAVYLNRVYLGAGTYGVEAAARRYFRRSARRVDLYQAAVLAGLPKAPSRYNPARNPALASRRAAVVLSAMVDTGLISAGQAADARVRGNVVVTATANARSGRYFADWVLDRVPDYVTPGDRDLVVRTTLDGALQRTTERRVKALLDELAQAGQAAVVVLSPNGALRAMVGGRDYARSQFNRASASRRQPGSAFKPFVYLAGLEAGMTPDSIVIDRPVSVGDWRPRNFDGRYRGPLTLRTALARSINTVAVTVAEQAGRRRVVATARRLGITSLLEPLPSLALGATGVSPLELVAAYAPFANGGLGVWPYGIVEITDTGGRTLYRRAGSGPGRVASPAQVVAMNDMLSAVIASGTGRAADIGRPAAGKTGTSQSFRDAWFVGYTADLVTGVWMGNDDGQPMKGVTGGGPPARLWRDIMAAAHQHLPPRSLPGLGDRPTDDQEGFWRRLLAKLGGGTG